MEVEAMKSSHKLVNALIGGILFISLPVLVKAAYFEYAPLNWFVDIEKIEAKQVDTQAVLYLVYRNVKYEMGGRYNRALFCALNNERLGEWHGDITFNRQEENLEQIRVAIDDRFNPNCQSYLFRVDYYLRMPNGSERKFPTMYTNVFDIKRDTEGSINPPNITAPMPAEHSKNGLPVFQSSRPVKTTEPGSSRVEVKVDNHQESKEESKPKEEPEEQKPVVEILLDRLGL